MKCKSRCSLNNGLPCKFWADCPVFKVDNGSKYHNIKCEKNGEKFDSRLELERWEMLKMWEKVGAIQNLQRQVKFELIGASEYGRAIYYIADFVYFLDGVKVVEDTKSKATKTPLYKLKKRLLAEKYGIKIKEIEK